VSADPGPAAVVAQQADDGPAQEDRVRRAASNTAALLGSRVVVAGLGWAGSVLIARALSAEDWGQYSFVFGLLGIVSVLADLGVGRVVLARLAADASPQGRAGHRPEDAEDARLLASSFIALRVVLGLLGYAVAMAYVLLVEHPAQVVQATALAGLVIVVATPSHALTVIFQSRLRMTAVATAEAAGQVLQLVLVVLAALLAPLLLVFVLPVLANEVLRLVWKTRALRRDRTAPLPARQVQLWRWRPMLVEAVPLAIGTAVATLLHKVDVVLLSRLDTFESVGQYSVAYKFADLLPLVASAVMAPWTTLLMLAWPSATADFRDRTRSASLVLAAVGAACAVAFWPAAGPVVTTLYGREYAPAADAARLLVAGACFAMLAHVAFCVLVASGRQRLYPVVGLLGLGLNVGLNVLLIPRQSFYGAALATVVTEVVVALLMWAAVWRTVPVRRLLPLGPVGLLGLTAAAVIAGGEAVSRLVPWPLVSAGSLLVVLALALRLDVPGARSLPGAVRRRAGRPS
jgi:O-antigen/teichoic acid export membrane protein